MSTRIRLDDGSEVIVEEAAPIVMDQIRYFQHHGDELVEFTRKGSLSIMSAAVRPSKVVLVECQP